MSFQNTTDGKVYVENNATSLEVWNLTFALGARSDDRTRKEEGEGAVKVNNSATAVSVPNSLLRGVVQSTYGDEEEEDGDNDDNDDGDDDDDDDDDDITPCFVAWFRVRITVSRRWMVMMMMMVMVMVMMMMMMMTMMMTAI